jgi:5-hydroxyisourate hydrolase-like protein (transthyretin family)
MRVTSALHSFVLVVILMSGVAAQRTPPAPSAIGLIAGRVLDVTSGQPVAGVTVSIRGAPTQPGTLTTPTTVLTDSQGRFAFPSLTNGRYTLHVQHDGYAPVRGAAVNLLAGQLVTDVELQVGRHGVITGTVRDDGGDPIVGVGVTAFSRRFLGFRPMLFPRGGAVSDDRGQFRISDLPPGDYLICACVRDSLPIDKSLLTRQGGIPASSVARKLAGAVLTFPPTFHPGSRRVADAVSVTVGYADDRRGIDITMQPAAARKVTGRLVGGEPNASTTHTLTLLVAADDPTAIGISEFPAARMTPEGGFEFAAVPPGKYTLEAYPSDGRKGLSASVTVTVGDDDVADVIVPLGPGATVRGRVEFSGAAARPDATTLEKARVGLVPIVLTPAMLISIGTSGSVGHSGILSRDGSFSIEGVPPGRYLVNAGQFGAAWQTIESVSTTEGRSFQPVVEVVAAGTDSLVVTMSDEAMATLEVTLALGKYELSNALRVAIFPVDRTFWSETYLAPGRFPFNFANANGLVSFTGVPADDYYVVELAPVESWSPERMAEWAKRATTVRLRAGEKTTVALRR